jgi:hypothetical protein
MYQRASDRSGFLVSEVGADKSSFIRQFTDETARVQCPAIAAFPVFLPCGMADS